MKKLLAMALSVVLLLGLSTVGVNALTLSEYTALKDEAHYADYFFDGLTADYVVIRVSQSFVDEKSADYNKDKMTQKCDSAQVEKFIKDRFALDDSLFAEVREQLGYKADGNYYDVPWIGGFGGFMAARELVGYVKNANNTYSFYYQTKNYEYLDESIWDTPENEGKDKIVHNGKTYESSPEGYVCDLGFRDGGLVHTLEMNGSVPRFLSTKEYTDKEKPAKFDAVPTKSTTTTTTTTTTKKLTTTTATVATTKAPTTTTATTVAVSTETVAQVEGLVLKTAQNVFPKDAVVKVEKVAESAPTYQTVQTALKPIAEKFVAYEITATKDNVTIQPNGKVTAEFDIPTGFDIDKLVALYVADDGKTEELISTVDPEVGKMTVEITHFSTYVIAEKTAESTEEVPTIGAQPQDDANDDKGGTPRVLIIAIAAIVLLGGGAAAWYFLIYKKK